MTPRDAQIPPGCADDEALEALVSGVLAPDRQGLLEAHLGSCAACRSRLDAHAAAPETWTTVREQLSAGGLAADDADDAVAPIPALAALIKKILAPSDDERMLGRLGPYEIAGIIGSGGMGIVLKGHDRALDRFVAIKLLAPHLASSGAARQRFLREAKAAAAVVHDNVIAIHGVDEFAGLPYLVMPYCRGTTLEKRVRDSGPMSLREILRVGLQTARGLAAAHAQGLVHRDVKPANILLEDGVERVRITDFGLARAADDASLTVTGLLAGTPHYMSPEQALGKPLDARSDLFALGAVLFTMATGSPPFRAESSHAVLRQVTDVEPADVRLANPDIPGWLSGIVRRLLAKDPAARYQSTAEVAGTLEACLAHVNDPLATPLPAEVARAAAILSCPAAPLAAPRPTPRTLFDASRRLMNDQRLLSIAALVIFLMALLLPWPILALGRAEPAIAYAVIAALATLLFAWLGRRDSLGRLVLKLAGTAAILGGAVVAFWVLSDSVLSGGRHNAQRVAAIRAENLAKQAQMEAIARQPNAPATIEPMTITVPTGPRVAPGPDPMPIVNWPAGRQPATVPPVATMMRTPPPGGTKMEPSAAEAPPAASLPTAQERAAALADSLERIERWLAEHPHEAIVTCTMRWPDGLEEFDAGPVTLDGPMPSELCEVLEGRTTWEKEFTTRFLGRSVAMVIRANAAAARSRTGDGGEIGVETAIEDDDGYQLQMYVSGDPATGAITTRELRIRFTTDGPFRVEKRTVCKDFRELAPGIWLPHRIEIASFDIAPGTPDNTIPRKPMLMTVVVNWWRPWREPTPVAGPDHFGTEAPAEVVPGSATESTDPTP